MKVKEEYTIKRLEEFSKIYLKDIKELGKDILIYGMEKFETDNGKEMMLSDGYPSVGIEVNKEKLYLYVCDMFGLNMKIDITKIKGLEKQVQEIKKAILSDEIEC